MDDSRLKRSLNPMADFVKEALLKENLMEKYLARPPYQQNDYLGWINRAKRPETREKRLNQMLLELRRGDRYMGMNHKPKR